MQLASCSNDIEDRVSEVLYEFTPEQVEALEATRRSFTPEEIAEAELRGRKHQELLVRLAATETLEEQEQLADEVYPEFDEWIRGRNRVKQATRRPRVVVTIVPRGARAQAAPRRRRDGSSSRSSGQDPGDDDPDPDDGPWALSLVDRAPFLWRFRALRCRLLEIREGVDR